MGNPFSKPPQDAESVAKLRQARTETQDYLTATQTTIVTDVNTNRLTPESGQAILQQIQSAFDWLKKNPNATLVEVYANRDSTVAEIARITKTDGPKKELRNIVTALPAILTDAVQKKLVEQPNADKVLAFKASTEDWLTKNGATATEIEFQQEQLKLNNKLDELLGSADAVRAVKDLLDKVKTGEPSQVALQTAEQQKKLKEAYNREVHVEDGLKTAGRVALQVFAISILVVLCLLCGSLAANMAIGRSRAYRVLYFLWGAFPVFAPFVGLYSLFKRLSDGPLPYYAILPLTIEPAVTRLGRLFMFPFYWIPDQQARDMAAAFQKSVEAISS